VRLSELIGDTRVPRGTLAAPADAADPVISGVELDSRAVVDGTLFCCVPGASADGHDFAAAAVANGAAALLVERHLDLDVPQVVTADARAMVGHLAAAFHGHPADSLTMVGVTGTNGKTTTTSLIAAVLRHTGWPTGLIGTLSGAHTTPEAPELQARLARFRSEGYRAVVMEVSSHALALHRVNGCQFDLAVFTNLGRDHLDLHGTMERYFAAKALLFTPTLSRRGLVNRDDVHGRLLIDAAQIPTDTFGLDDVTDIEVSAARHGYRWHGTAVEVPLGGRFNVANSIAAARACELLGLAPDVVAAGLATMPPVPGRLEAVEAGQPFTVLVDYAHTPDGLRELLSTVGEVTRPAGGRVLVVFGCGGDRDRDKRAEMGAVAAELAELVVVTSDNPRSEEPQAIIDAVCAGVPEGYGDRLVTQVDRRAAIGTALSAARPGDAVVIAGKGHETTQTIGADVVAFDDRLVARELLEALR
jgi:UDP-N-acetylmuramoyl-L-alanyl-D-glutamate--2,6-diaminopimelate ligase